MPRKAKDIPLQKHQEPLPEAPAKWKQGEPEEGLKALIVRASKAGEKRDAWLEVLREDFEASENLLYVADAYLLVRQPSKTTGFRSAKPIPEWILNGMEGVAGEAFHPPAKKTGNSRLDRYERLWLRREAVDFIIKARNEDPPLTVTAACDLAADFLESKRERRDPETIRKWYDSYVQTLREKFPGN